MRRNSATRRNFRNAPNFPGLRKMLRYQKNSPDSVECAEFCKVTPIPPNLSEFCRIQRITPNLPNSSGFCRMADFSRIHPSRRSGDSEIVESCGGVEFRQNGKWWAAVMFSLDAVASAAGVGKSVTIRRMFSDTQTPDPQIARGGEVH